MPKTIVGYALTSEDMVNAGGPMGGAGTTTNWTRNFSTPEKAKAVAEKDYAKARPGEKIEWRGSKRDRITSGDLSFVMYDITPIIIES